MSLSKNQTLTCEISSLMIQDLLKEKAISYLIRVVGAGHQQEDPGKGVFSGIWDLPGLRSCRKTQTHEF